MLSYLKTMIDLYIPSVDEAEEGQGMVEYALILALISIAAIAVLLLIGPQITEVFQRVTDGLSNAGVGD